MVVPQPQKRPRSSHRRFEAALVHELWQLDAFEWPLLDGSPAVVFQLEDDHPAARPRPGPRPGRPARTRSRSSTPGWPPTRCRADSLTDNHASLNPTRRGVVGQLVSHVEQLGVKPITGRPRHPQTQGKDERLHATTVKWLWASLAPRPCWELQAQLDESDHYYNHVRGHQALARDSAGLLRTPAQAVTEDPDRLRQYRPTPNPSLWFAADRRRWHLVRGG